MLYIEKLQDFVKNLSDLELVDAVKHLNDVTFSEDNVIRVMFENSIDEDEKYGLIFYIGSITKVLCDEATERMNIYSPHTK